MSVKELFIKGFDEFRTKLEDDFEEYHLTLDNMDEYHTDLDVIDELKPKLDEVRAMSTPFPLLPQSREPKSSSAGRERIEDDFLEYLIFAYQNGIEAVNEMLATGIMPNDDKMYSSLTLKIEGKTYVDRVREYVAKGDTGALMKVAETEYHRMFNEAILSGGMEAGATTKTWVTMQDSKVRDTHDYLFGETIPIDENFYTYDGDYAKTPSGFTRAENNVNCRCYIEIK